MKYVRLFEGEDGESHPEDVEVALDPTPVLPGVPPRGVSAARVAEGVQFVSAPAETRDEEWHNAPCRQFIFYLEGNVVLEASDGAQRRLGPGSVVLVEDTRGKGHRYLDDGGSMQLAFVALR